MPRAKVKPETPPADVTQINMRLHVKLVEQVDRVVQGMIASNPKLKKTLSRTVAFEKGARLWLQSVARNGPGAIGEEGGTLPLTPPPAIDPAALQGHTLQDKAPETAIQPPILTDTIANRPQPGTLYEVFSDEAEDLDILDPGLYANAPQQIPPPPTLEEVAQVWEKYWGELGLMEPAEALQAVKTMEKQRTKLPRGVRTWPRAQLFLWLAEHWGMP